MKVSRSMAIAEMALRLSRVAAGFIGSRGPAPRRTDESRSPEHHTFFAPAFEKITGFTLRLHARTTFGGDALAIGLRECQNELRGSGGNEASRGPPLYRPLVSRFF